MRPRTAFAACSSERFSTHCLTVTRASRHGASAGCPSLGKEMLPNTLRICMYTLPFGYAARATRTVSAGTEEIACDLSDSGVLLMALPERFLLLFLPSLFLYWHVFRNSPVVSKP